MTACCEPHLLEIIKVLLVEAENTAPYQLNSTF